MIRRSTLVFLTCLSAFSVPAIQTKSAASPIGVAAGNLTGSDAPLIVAQATEPSFNGLAIGSKGESVRQLQTRLKATDYYDGPIDGLYGIATRKAIVSLQRTAGLTETGTLNEETWEALEALSETPAEDASATSETSEISEVSDDTAPTESELPPIGEGADAPDIILPDQNEGGLGQVFGLSLGLVALLASFGIGFYIANKGKREVEETEGWDALDPNANAAAPVPPTSNSPDAGLLAVGGGGTNHALQPEHGQLSTQASGQMGATAPLSQTDIIDGLVGELRNPDPVKRRKVIWELGQRGNSIAVQPLVDAMVDADSKEKSLLLASLSEIGIRSLKPMNRALAIALQDNNPEVRKNAIRDLSRIYDLVIQISHMLGHATEDEDPEVRQTATWALDKLNHLRKSQDIDNNMRSFSSGGTPPIDLLSSEASIRRSKEMR